MQDGRDTQLYNIYCRVNYKMTENGIVRNLQRANHNLFDVQSDVTERPVKLSGHSVTVLDCAI